MGEFLPDNYTYFYLSHIKDKSVANFRIKEIIDKTGALDWVKKYSMLSKTTWRVSKTYPKIGRFNIYKIEYRCVHHTDRRAKGTGPSKHTGCEAKIQLTIRRYIEKPKRQKPDNLIKDFPCIVMIKSDHNHDLNSPSILKHRDLAPEIKEKFIALHKAGHSPSAALMIHKTDLKIEFKDKYNEIEFDGQYMPTHSVVYKLFQKLSPDMPVKKKRLLKRTKAVLPVRVPEHVPEVDDPTSGICRTNQTVEDTNLETTTPDVAELCPPPGADVEETEVNNIEQDILPSTDKSMALTDAEQQQFCDLFQRIQSGLDNNPGLFVPAVRSLLQNEKKYATTDTDLLRALHLFGNFSSVRKMSADNVARRTKKRQTEKSADSPTKKSRKVCASVPQNTLYHCVDNNHPQEYHSQEYPARPTQNYNLTYQVNYGSFYNM